jgi:hypothetical protein
MRLMTVAALGAVSLATLATVLPAAAQGPRTYRNDTETITVIDQHGHKTTRITVRPRSFLDPGTAQREPYQYHYTDYAVPPQKYFGESLTPTDRTDWKASWSRMPFPDCADLPGYCHTGFPF